MAIGTKRWNDPPSPEDGTRILITRYRPRGIRKSDETWDEWFPQLGPSRELHAAVYGKHGRTPITWSIYRSRYLAEMRHQRDAIRMLAERVSHGETITLLCSSACVRESRCHRSLLKGLIRAETGKHPLKNGNYDAIAYARASLARKIIRDRRVAGLSQAELARRAGIRDETLNRIEKLKLTPRIAIVEKIDRALRRA